MPNPSISKKPPLLSITDAAVQHIKELMNQNEKNSGAIGLRVGVKRGGCTGLEYVFEYALAISPGDEIIEHNGAKIIVSSESQLYLLGTELDYVSTKMRSGFIFTNPNAKGHCGCGKSFHL